MQHRPSLSDQGLILIHHCSGVLEPEAIRRLVENPQDVPGHDEARAFVVDLTEATVNHLNTDFIRELGKVAADMRRQHEDYRPTFIAAPAALTRGLANMLSGYRGDELQQVYASMDDALQAARDRLGIDS